MRSLKTPGEKYLLSLYRYSNQDEHQKIKQLWNLISAKKMTNFIGQSCEIDLKAFLESHQKLLGHPPFKLFS